jgi:predicted kinase
MPVLYIFSGLPGSGKSTIAALLAKHLGATYLRVDTIEQALKELCNLNVYAEGYQLAYRLASDNLAQGLSVIGDSCNTVPESRIEWEQAAIKSNAQYINIEIVCSVQVEHKSRIQNRKTPISRLILPTWEEVKLREYHPWDSEVISIDTAGKTQEQSIKELLSKLSM